MLDRYRYATASFGDETLEVEVVGVDALGLGPNEIEEMPSDLLLLSARCRVETLRQRQDGPAEGVVALCEAQDRVAQGSDADDGPVRTRLVSDQVVHVPARRRLVRDRPLQARIPPDVLEPKARLGIRASSVTISRTGRIAAWAMPVLACLLDALRQFRAVGEDEPQPRCAPSGDERRDRWREQLVCNSEPKRVAQVGLCLGGIVTSRRQHRRQDVDPVVVRAGHPPLEDEVAEQPETSRGSRPWAAGRPRRHRVAATAHAAPLRCRWHGGHR